MLGHAPNMTAPVGAYFQQGRPCWDFLPTGPSLLGLLPTQLSLLGHAPNAAVPVGTRSRHDRPCWGSLTT
eukprot:7616235-Pyramimonas_sp.AAC.1